jgi:hypothetical protein
LFWQIEELEAEVVCFYFDLQGQNGVEIILYGIQLLTNWLVMAN